MGSRMDGCKAALGRAIKKRQQAVETLEAARIALQAAEKHVTDKAEELKQLETDCRMKRQGRNARKGCA